MANETERLRSALLSSVSHDLRSPLAAMVGSASSLANYAGAMSEDDRKSLLDTILLKGDRLDRYIQDLLDMTRLGHTGLTLNRDWIGVDELVGSATGRLRRYQPDVKLQVDLEAGLPPIWVHPALIEQALFNVLENAAKFSPPGEAIEVSARVADGRLQLDVRDRGPGIPEQEHSRIFDMFYSVERGDRGRQGTGLGLTIAQGMVGAHGGSVQALPGQDHVGTLIRRFLDISLRAQGYGVALAASAREGLELLAARGADLVVLDIDLPDMDGHEVLRELRGWSQVPVIMLTVRAGEEEKVAALDAGANDYVTHTKDTHYVRELVGKLQQKLGDDAAEPRWIATEPGVGLRFIPTMNYSALCFAK